MRTVGSYEIVSELGQGGMGRVYRVRHMPTGAVRALKVLAPDAHPQLIERFKREAEATARLAGDGVVPIHETGVVGSSHYYVMDLMPGGSLRARIAGRGRFEWRDAVALVSTVARTLERCHSAGLVHRDVKPENILLDDAGRPRVADFGCVKDLDARSLTQTGQTLGTFVYMPPEQVLAGPVHAGMDVFALAVVLHEMVAGVHPYGAEQVIETVLTIMQQGKRQRLSKLAAAPPALDAILDRALAHDPEQRTRSSASSTPSSAATSRARRGARRSPSRPSRP